MPYAAGRSGYRSGVPAPMPDLLWSPVDADADEVLAAQVGSRYDGAVATGRLCGRCGSSGHGRPWARAGQVDVPVSLARAGRYLVTVVADPGTRAIGVDVEVVDRDWPLDVLLAPGEQAADDLAAAALWVAKEAILKADGFGLDRPPSGVVVADFAGELERPVAPAGYLAALALRRR